MRSIIVDDESLAITYLLSVCEEIYDIEIVGKFTDASSAIQFVKDNPVDLAFLDIEMPEMNGITLGKKLHEIDNSLVLVYTTGYEQYALDAFKNRAIAYILKPCDAEDIRYAVNTAKLLVNAEKKQVFIRTFGRFDVFVNGTPVIFSNAKSKELFALLVDQRGGEVSMEQAIDVLWEDKPYGASVKSLYRRAVADMKNTMNALTKQSIFHIGRATCQLDISAVDCDYYQLLEGNKNRIKEFSNEYMFDYSWAEQTLIKIQSIIDNL
ncbi:MAG TPA: response regulator [Ruminiclostridium sp.]|nr:response regulator [Ruminiclostridium sp.]